MKVLEILVLLGLVLFLFLTQRNETQKEYKPQKQKTEHRPLIPLTKTKEVILPHHEVKIVPHFFKSAPRSDEFNFPPLVKTEKDAEILDHLIMMEGDRGNLIYNQYKLEQEEHRNALTDNLVLSMNELNGLNGESGTEYDEAGELKVRPGDPVKMDTAYVARMKTILGDHYEYVNEREVIEEVEN